MATDEAHHRRLNATGEATVDEAFDALRNRILDGTLRPGERLRARALAEQLGTGTTTIRGAVNRLAAIGLVTQIPHHGATVVDLSPAGRAELYGARLVIEPPTALLGAEAIDARGIAELRRTIDALSAAVARQDVLLALQLDVAFRRRLYRAAGNPTLMDLIEQIGQRVMPYELFDAATATDDVVDRFLADGRAILAACERGDGADVERLRASSLTQTSERLAARLRPTP